MGSQLAGPQVDGAVQAVEQVGVGVEVLVFDDHARDAARQLHHRGDYARRLRLQRPLEQVLAVVAADTVRCRQPEQVAGDTLRLLDDQRVVLVDCPPGPVEHEPPAPRVRELEAPRAQIHETRRVAGVGEAVAVCGDRNRVLRCVAIRHVAVRARRLESVVAVLVGEVGGIGRVGAGIVERLVRHQTVTSMASPTATSRAA
jgi:hypothetical protein